MPWIRLPKPDLSVLSQIRSGLPPEYTRPPSSLLPEAARKDSIVMAHTLAPQAMVGTLSGYNALLSAELPLSRKQQEMIAVVVSSINDCFY